MTKALLTLHGLQAINDKGKLTKMGKQMATLPLDPVYARVLLASFEHGCASAMIDLVSLLGSRDSLLSSNMVTRDAANAAHQKFRHRTGDHLLLLNVLRAFEDVDKDERAQWCRDNFVNARSLKQVLEARKQLRERCERMGLSWADSDGGELGGEAETDAILTSLVGGLFANSALLQPDGTYRHALSRQAIHIHPGSTLHLKKAEAIIYDELVLTTKTYARGVSAISPLLLRSGAPNVFEATAERSAGMDEE